MTYVGSCIIPILLDIYHEIPSNDNNQSYLMDIVGSALQELESSDSTKIQRLHEMISDLTSLAEKTPTSEKVQILFQTLKSGEDKEKISYYLKHPQKCKKEEIQEDLRKIVQNFDLNELIDGDVLAIHLSRSESTFLRSLLHICIERGQNPQYINRFGTSLFSGLLEREDLTLIDSLTKRMNQIDLQKCLLSKRALSMTALEHCTDLKLLLKIMDTANIPPTHDLLNGTLWMHFVKISVDHVQNDLKTTIDLFFERYGHLISLEESEKALIYILKKEDYSNPILVKLIEKGFRPQTIKGKEKLEDSVHEILTSKSKKLNEGRSFIIELINHKSFPFLTTDYSLTFKKLPKDEEIRTLLEDQFPKDLIDKTKHFLPILKSIHLYEETFDLYTLQEQIEKLEPFFADTQFCNEKYGFQHQFHEIKNRIEFLKNNLKERKDAVAAWLKEYDENNKIIKVNEFPLDRTIYLVHQNRWDILEKAGKHTFNGGKGFDSNLIVTQVLLNQLIKPEFEAITGSLIEPMTFWLLDIMESYLVDLPNKDFIPPEKRECIENTLASAIRALRLITFSKRTPNIIADLAYQAYLNGISPVLIPSGEIDHSVLFALYQDESGTKAMLFNSGDGLEYHPGNKDESKFQTYIGIANIPKEEITFSLLKKIAKAADNESIKPLYDLFDGLKQKGNPLPPSNDPFDYETPQVFLGTCSVQSQMAFLRYHCLEGFGKSVYDNSELAKLETMGLYKVVKTSLLKELGEKQLSKVVPRVQKACQKRLAEISLQGELWKISLLPDRWKALMLIIDKEMQIKGISSLIKETYTAEKIPPIARLYLLERQLRLLSDRWDKVSNIPDFMELTPFFKFLVDKKIERKKDLFALLDSARSERDFDKIEEYLYMARRAKIEPSEWLKKDFSANRDFWVELKNGSKKSRNFMKEVQKYAPHLFE